MRNVGVIHYKSGKNAIIDAIDCQIPVTQLRGVRGRFRYAKRLFPRLHTLFAYNFLMNGSI